MTNKKKTVAIIGASGAVGSELIHLLKARNFPYKSLRLFASHARDAFEKLENLDGIDLAFFAAGSKVSKEWIPKAKCRCIDLSSAFRKSHPLIIPEINPDAIEGPIITSPNCAATILLMPLFPLHKLFQVKRIVVATYQAASGGGAFLMNRLLNETQSYLSSKNKIDLPSKEIPYAFNLFLHNSPLQENGYSEEEVKMVDETRKILSDHSIQMSATCVRVPVLRAHSISVNVEFKTPFTLEKVYETLKKTAGIQVFEDRNLNRFPTPLDAQGKNEIFCGRFRIDPSQPNTLEFWAVGDQLLKGAALNAVQIAEYLEEKNH